MTATTDPILPPPLRRGDVIGLVAPAGPLRGEEEFSAGVRLIREMGFEVSFSRTIRRHRGYLAGADAERAEELNRLWADEQVKALLAVRGGYGSIRVTDSLDYRLIRQRPKILAGFSDITVLHCAIGREANLVTFHGPMLTTLAASDRPSVARFFKTLTSTAPPDPITPDSLEILRRGDATGRLLAGNLATLTHLLGTPWEPDWDDTILIIEDTGEAAYRLDRMLTQLALAGRLERIAGLLLGSFDGCDDVEAVWHRALELTEAAAIPVWADFPVGHGPANMAVPIGVTAAMDSAAGSLRFLSPCTATR